MSKWRLYNTFLTTTFLEELASSLYSLSKHCLKIRDQELCVNFVTRFHYSNPDPQTLKIFIKPTFLSQKQRPGMLKNLWKLQMLGFQQNCQSADITLREGRGHICLSWPNPKAWEQKLQSFTELYDSQVMMLFFYFSTGGWTYWTLNLRLFIVGAFSSVWESWCHKKLSYRS